MVKSFEKHLIPFLVFFTAQFTPYVPTNYSTFISYFMVQSNY